MRGRAEGVVELAADPVTSDETPGGAGDEAAELIAALRDADPEAARMIVDSALGAVRAAAAAVEPVPRSVVDAAVAAARTAAAGASASGEQCGPDAAADDGKATGDDRADRGRPAAEHTDVA